MPASFGIEALKAQVARTYVAAKRGRPCDIAKGGDCYTTHCQVYIGKEERIAQNDAGLAAKFGIKFLRLWMKLRG